MYSSKAPGSVMLLGEHAVVYGRPALVTSIDKYITATLSLNTKPRHRVFVVNSSIGSIRLLADDLENDNLKNYDKNFNFVLEVIKFFLRLDPFLFEKISKYELNIQSELSTEFGFGTSAAVIVAVYNVFLKFLNINEIKKQRFINLKQIMLTIQKVGSGADIAASLYQGVVYFDGENLDNIKVIEKNILEKFPKLFLIYSGYKTKTPEVINIVKKNIIEVDKNIFNRIFDNIEECVNLGYEAIKTSSFVKLGKIFNIHQGLQDSMGVNDLVLSEIIYSLRNDSTVLGAKISGSGLGDCVIALADNKSKLNNQNYLLEKYKIIKIKF